MCRAAELAARPGRVVTDPNGRSVDLLGVTVTIPISRHEPALEPSHMIKAFTGSGLLQQPGIYRMTSHKDGAFKSS